METVTVIVVTLNRPECVRCCLECLRAQTRVPDQVIVVDASKDDLTKEVVAGFPEAMYLRNEAGFGRMTASRNIGLAHSTGEFIAFVDDDAFAHEQWMAKLLETYTDDKIGAVGGRALNAQPNEALQGVDEIGKLKHCGELTGNFAADPGRIIEVDHVIGCNMSFRRSVVEALGGFREDYPGISGVREDSDMCMRVKRLGYRILFNPAACVDHIAAPQAKGKRFDNVYAFYATRNQFVLLVRNFGVGAPVVYRYIFYSTWHFVLKPFISQMAKSFSLLGATSYGTVAGLFAGARLLRQDRNDPVRRDPRADELRVAMSERSREHMLPRLVDGAANSEGRKSLVASSSTP